MKEAEWSFRLREKYKDRDTRNFGIMDFLGAFGSPLDALMYARLFWPEFVEIEGMVFLRQTVEDEKDRIAVMAELQRNGGDSKKTERNFNLVEIPSGVFTANLGETTDEDDRLLADLLASMWKARLSSVFPDRKFDVTVLSADDTGGEVAVSFCQA